MLSLPTVDTPELKTVVACCPETHDDNILVCNIHVHLNLTEVRKFNIIVHLYIEVSYS